MTSNTSPVIHQFQQPLQSSPSTTSSSTTLVTFTSPRRTYTASSTSTAHSTLSEASTLSQNTYSRSHPFHSDIHPTPRSRGRSQTYPNHGSHGTIPSRNRNSYEVTMTPQQAELLRYKGTYTDSGRHSDDWLFGGWSFVGTVKGAWRKVAPGPNGRGGEGEGER